MKSIRNIACFKLKQIKDNKSDTVDFAGETICLAGSSTGKGVRKLLVCPECDKHVMELRRVLCRDDSGKAFAKIMCRHCSPLEKTRYEKRMKLGIGNEYEILTYKIAKLQMKHAIIMDGGSPREVSPFMSSIEDVLRQWKRPKGMHQKTYERIVVKLYWLYRLRDPLTRINLIQQGYSMSISDINKRLTKTELDGYARDHIPHLSI